MRPLPCGARDLPVLERGEELVHDAALTPEHLNGTFDAPCGVGAVVLEIDRRRGAIVLAHRVDRAWEGEAALVLGERARIEERRAVRAPAAELRAQIERGGAAPISVSGSGSG